MQFGKVVGSPLFAFGKVLNRFVVLPAYALIVKVARIFGTILEPVNNKFLIPFLNRYITHILMLVMTVGVMALNYQIKESSAQGFGEDSILYYLVQGGDLDDLYIEETVDETHATTSYFEGEFVGDAPTTITTTQPSIVSTQEEIVDVAVVTGDAVAPTAISSIEASKKKRDKIINYVVKEGDTVSGIASQFGLKTTSLLWANNMSAGSYLKPGQNLDIPPVDGIIYTVAKGDKLSTIAKKYNSKVDDIISFNKLADASDITTGLVLVLPGGEPYRAPAPIQPVKVAPVKNIFTGNQKPDTSKDGFIWPTTTRRISQYYSWRHTALDIDGEFGDIIWSIGDGTVSRVQYLTRDYGYHVIVDHGNGVQSLYAHFQKIYVQPGQKVKKGDSLGEMGSTGRSTGSHLHFEVRVGGKRLNPFAWVSK
ncbi:M23 family metallopeptidase [Candidatus Falkowbacteria bacterium]|nr:M23 family metallopeptidase [Candidatus Falkowbacteria bacterium]